MKDLRLSIAKKLLLHLYLISTTVAAVITVATSYLDYSRESKELNHAAEQIEKISTQGVAALLWNRDIESIETQMGSILQNPIVHKISILDDSGAVLFSSDATGHEVPRHAFERAADIKYDTGGGEVPIGRINFVMSEDKVIDGVVSRFLAVLLLNAFKAVVVSYLLFLVLRRLVTRPVEDLVRYFHSTEVPKSEDVKIEVHAQTHW